MIGAHHLMIQSVHLKYEMDIIRNITIIQGDSATGKTTLVDMIREYILNGSDTGITLSCDVPCRLVEGNTWQEQLGNIHGSIVFIDEGNRFVASVDFAEAIKNTDNYYVIITREGLQALPYSVTEIYGIHSSGKFNSLEPVYHELYRIYGEEIGGDERPNAVIVEDSNSGFDFFIHLFGKDVKCISANGKDNIIKILNSRELSGNILVIADGAAFGSQMAKVHDFVSRNQGTRLYLPESFEWIILDADILSDPDVRKVLDSPQDYVQIEKYFSWERFFTHLLVEKSSGTYLKYSKTKLNDAFLQKKIMQKIVEKLPDEVYKK